MFDDIGDEALVSCGIMESLIRVINWYDNDDGQDHITVSSVFPLYLHCDHISYTLFICTCTCLFTTVGKPIHVRV